MLTKHDKTELFSIPRQWTAFPARLRIFYLGDVFPRFYSDSFIDDRILDL